MKVEATFVKSFAFGLLLISPVFMQCSDENQLNSRTGYRFKCDNQEEGLSIELKGAYILHCNPDTLFTVQPKIIYEASISNTTDSVIDLPKGWRVFSFLNDNEEIFDSSRVSVGHPQSIPSNTKLDFSFDEKLDFPMVEKYYYLCDSTIYYKKANASRIIYRIIPFPKSLLSNREFPKDSAFYCLQKVEDYRVYPANIIPVGNWMKKLIKESEQAAFIIVDSIK